ncbi:NB-ARC domain-containing protein [Streptomyces capillispiralis]|uniref:NB-ARC domain-containing protein n=1 Tax=Streptomyces capillispiralis TaxID=68182 RepID=UPI0036982B2A
MSTGTPATGGFGERLHGLRRRAGLSQEDLAHASGVSVRALSDLERGRARGPQRRTVEALAAALKLDAAGARELERAASLGRPRPRTRPAIQSTLRQAAEDTPGQTAGAGTQPASAGAAGLTGATNTGRITAPIAPNTLALPRDLRDFTARGPALARLLKLAEDLDPAHPPVAVICGQPGLGKTTFAVHAAHALAPHFPDGQFAVDLRGMDTTPTQPRDALARLLRALGTTEGTIPTGTEDRCGLLRSVLRDRRVLLLLDNAADEEQVRPLLPAQGPSLTLITSRHALGALEAAHRTELALLRREEAVELLTRIIGPERVQRESQAARDLADLCGNLPLAVRIAGQRLASRPGESIAKLVTQLGAHERRLDTLRAGSLQVRTAFDLSYRQLSPATRTVFRRASLAAGPDFSPETLALLADLSPRQAAGCAQDLTDAGLLQPHPTADRYRFHDLLALFAGEKVIEEDEPAQIAAARERTDKWTLRRATTAALLFDAEHRQHADDADPDPATAPADREEAHTWLEAERAQWLAALVRAQADGRHQEVVQAAEAMHWFSDRTLHWELWADVFRRSVDSARALGSKRDEAVHLNYLAWAYNVCLYDHDSALTTAEAALDVAREIDDRLQASWALNYAAEALHRLHRVEESITQLHEAADQLGRHNDVRSRLAELTTLNNLGRYLRQAGRAEEALTIHRRSEAMCSAGVPGKSPDLIGLYLASARQHIGNDLAALNRWTEAEAPLRFAVARFDTGRMPAWCESARLDLGRVLRRLDRHQEAWETLTAAHEALTELDHPRQVEAAAELAELREPGEHTEDTRPTRPARGR